MKRPRGYAPGRRVKGQYCDTNLTAAYETCGTAQNPVETFAYDTDGNLTQDGAYTYTWDGGTLDSRLRLCRRPAAGTRCVRRVSRENRLVSVAPVSQPVDGSKQLTFSYDYKSRRVRKQVWTWATDNWQLTTDSRFVYDDWNVIMVLSGAGNTVISKYTWGLDLSGLAGDASTSGIHGAGGIGGLLAVEEPQAVGDPKRYWFFYDANGNVGQLVRADNQAIAARYEYDAYGNKLVAADGQYDPGLAEANPFRFSTKWLDGELGDYSMYYYGYRYYLPRIGRWGSRDPIGEKESANLYGFTRGAPVERYDPHGLRTFWLCSKGEAESRYKQCMVGALASCKPMCDACGIMPWMCDACAACTAGAAVGCGVSVVGSCAVSLSWPLDGVLCGLAPELLGNTCGQCSECGGGQPGPVAGPPQGAPTCYPWGNAWSQADCIGYCAKKAAKDQCDAMKLSKLVEEVLSGTPAGAAAKAWGVLNDIEGFSACVRNCDEMQKQKETGRKNPGCKDPWEWRPKRH